MRAAAAVEDLRTRHHGRIVIDAVVPDYYARLSEALPRRLGPPLAQCHAVRHGAAVPRRRIDPRPRILERARAFARRDLGGFSGVQRLPRHRLDEGAVRELSEAGTGFRRLPLPGVRADRRRRARPIRSAISLPIMHGWRRSRRCRPTRRITTAACSLDRGFPTRIFPVALARRVLDTAARDTIRTSLGSFHLLPCQTTGFKYD